MKNYNMISTEKPPKYQFYHPAKLISISISYQLGKAFEKKTIEDQGERQMKAIQNQGEINTIKNIFMIVKILQ